jgi:hypothetical protein
MRKLVSAGIIRDAVKVTKQVFEARLLVKAKSVVAGVKS